MKKQQIKPDSLELKPKKRNYFLFIVQLLSFIFLFFVIILTVIVGYFYHTWWYQFKQAAHLSDHEIVTLIKEGIKFPITQTNNRKNILVLGVDTLANRAGDPVLTDTIMMFSLDTQSGGLKAVSLPRDLWSVEYKTKINSLYEYGETKYPEVPERFPTEVIEELTQLHFEQVVVISLDQLKELIDILGGIEVQIPEEFVDDAFPRTDVDIRIEHDPKKLYETITFVEGTEKMSGERALKYVRSRHSTQNDQGTDNARSVRQQLVINAIINKVKQAETLKNPVVLGNLYSWYFHNFDSILSVKEIIHLGYNLQKKVLNISLQPQTLSFELDGSQGVIIHPPITKYQQWVYEVKDLNAFHQEVNHKLGL